MNQNSNFKNTTFNKEDFNKTITGQIVNQIDIVSVIESYIPLTKKGSSYWGICPFHQDSNPSMSVDPNRKMFKCFTCNEHGNVIDFVSKYTNQDKQKVKEQFAKQLGLSYKKSQKELEHEKNEKYYAILKSATDFYHFFLMNTVDGEEALHYIHSRGLDDEVLNRFMIGASGNNDDLYDRLKKDNFLPLDMIEVNLIKPMNYKDVFKNRVMFPLENLDGEVVGFSGRKFKPGDESSKYLNTTDTIIFKKGDILYNYHRAIKSIKEKDCVFLYEGFMDVIASVRAGFDNSVASMGTALTENQINAIKRVTNNIVVGYDSDGAGVSATLRAIDMLICSGFNIKVICIPDGKDADEFIFKNGKEALYSILSNNLINGIDFIYNIALKELVLEDVNSIEKFKTTIYKTIQKFNKLTITETYLAKLADEIHIDKEAIKKDYETFAATHAVEFEHPIASVREGTNHQVHSYQTNNQSDMPYIPEDIPPEYMGDNFSPYDFNDGDVIQDGPNQNRKTSVYADFETINQVYKKCEETLVIACYNSKTNCKEIIGKLDNIFVEPINREIMNKILEYYFNFEVCDEKMIFSLLDNEEQAKLRKLLDTKSFPDKKTINACIDKIKKYPVQQVINQTLQEEQNEKTLGDLVKTVKLKEIKIISKHKKES